ncbi:MAG: hypothetical protein PHV08_04065 [Sulfurovaceae bacterium]|nr:hypothetical protein [Sulfurovaceae bacterium]
MKNISVLGILVLIAAMITGCAPELDTTYMQNESEKISIAKHKSFDAKLEEVASVVKQDPNYKKINLETKEEKDWFKQLSYRLWDKQITKTQFIEAGVTRYPSNYYEFDLIATWLLK